MKRYRIVEFYDFPLRKVRNNTLRSAINGGGGAGGGCLNHSFMSKKGLSASLCENIMVM